ncbi:PREDICTED: pyridoxine/pyridoxamine 5'-phosphate oxidase 1, chloroplastic-like isoform X2 [Ipomoea nil]|uniref:pyridoxine/pyridoxamine 5'-phosphate oxidase 1, chloroplastic-like isoform X2 n=1 Tax=Ipomoea nil TaxID=35883 RepID=UPI000901563F|nr:PREDICTED: pyridoxine/pyridoxamine 5'-phosphate oxidase 1, chloroplastic-like isoform X2 [Ipomoea nil]
MGSTTPISYLTHQEATEIDHLLMGPLGFSIDQLMELAGLSIATAIAEVYNPKEYRRILVICGPGSNGGDGLVAARHLHYFGYELFLCYPMQTPKHPYTGLVTQLESLSIPFLHVEGLPADLSDDFDVIVDSIFGFSFHGTPKPPFDELIQRLVSLKNPRDSHRKSPVIVSVDIPSGWHVDGGDINGEGIRPSMLVSLTAPKLCAKRFYGPHHFLGGRFIPPSIVDKFKLRLPLYPGTSMCVRIGRPPEIYPLALLGMHVEADPFDQFKKWFDHALVAGVKEPNYMALSTGTKDGKPSSRVVSLEGVNKDGFVWYTSYESRKAREISENPHASLLFYWSCLNCQIRVDGFVQKVSDEESEQYFHSLPRDIQIRPIISKQSTEIPGREILHQQYKELDGKYPEGSLMPRPKHWGGYRLVPKYFEFWQGEESRVNLNSYVHLYDMMDRLCYISEEKEIDGRKRWKIMQRNTLMESSSKF